jgi:hypothetical protein
MPKPTIQFDDNLFRSECRRMLTQLDIAEEPFIRGEAGFFAQALSKITPPFDSFPRISGSGYNAQLRQKRVGESSIRGDMANIFTVRSRGFLQYCARRGGSTRNVDFVHRRSGGEEIQVRALELNWTSVRRALSFHESKRNFRGRTPSYNGSGSDRWHSNEQMWITEEIWDAVYENLIQKVGIAKAAFASYAVAFGRPNPPTWIRRHMGGVIPIVTSSPTTQTTMTATAPALDVAARNLGRVNQVRVESMRSKLRRMVRTQARQTSWQSSIL